MNFIFIVPRKFSADHSSEPANEYMLSYAINNRDELKKSISAWNAIAQSSGYVCEKDIEIIELYIPAKQYDTQKDTYGAYVSADIRNQILQENEKCKLEFFTNPINQSTNKSPALSQISFLNRQISSNATSDDFNHKKLSTNKPLATPR